MAVSVDTVYQRVLALANKEQRGYITPQEYNLLANQAQMQIFESYFYAKNQRERAEPDRTAEVDETDISELIDLKLRPFLSVETLPGGTNLPSSINDNGVSYNIYHTGNIFYNGQVCSKISINELNRMSRSVRHYSTTQDQSPVYIDSYNSGEDVLVYAGPTATGTFANKTSGVTIECFRKPKQVEWAYVVVNEKALYNSNVAVDFELHISEEDTLVNIILGLAGIVMSKPGLLDVASQITANENNNQKL